jgi:hypothetical protein
VSEEPAGGTVVGEQDGPHDAGGAVGNRTPAQPSHVGGDPAGADRVDQYARPRELAGEHAGQSIYKGVFSDDGDRLDGSWVLSGRRWLLLDRHQTQVEEGDDAGRATR